MKFLEVAKKDLIIEFRNKNTLSFMFLFSFLTLMIFSAVIESPDPSILWIVFIFAGILGYSRAFLREAEKETIYALKISPLSPLSILFGKIIYNLILMLILEAIVTPLFIAIFSIYPKDVFLAFSVLTIGNFAFVVVCSSLTILTLKSRAREMLLPILLFPVIFPIIVSTVKAFKMAIYGNIQSIASPISIIIGFSIAVIAVSMLTIDYAFIE